MSDDPLSRMLGGIDPDAGCDATFAVLDQYVEALRAGQDVASRYAEVLAHLENCAACREEADALLAALENLPPTDR